MKLLAILSSVDLSFKAAGVPVFWQLLKGFHDCGISVVVITMEGTSFATPWWRIYSRPFVQRKAVDFILKVGKGFGQNIAGPIYYKGWKKVLKKVFVEEKDVDAILFSSSITVSKGVALWIRKDFGIPMIYYETDIQNLPKYSLDNQPEKHLFPDYSAFDVVACSFEKISRELKEHGLQNVWTVPFGADPGLFSPLEGIKQDIDVYFSGYGALDRESWMTDMISTPSKALRNTKFLVEGTFKIDLGNAQRIPSVSLDNYVHYCCRSKINLNILRQQFIKAGVLNSRVFELASLGCCIVTNPSSCLQKFFEPDKEIVVVKDFKDATDKYDWLLSSEIDRFRIGKAARQRIIREHTYLHRAQEMLRILNNLN